VRALLLQYLYGSQRTDVDGALEYNLLFRWLLADMDEAVWCRRVTRIGTGFGR